MRDIKFRGMTVPPKDFGDYKFTSKMVYGTGIFFDPINTWLLAHDPSMCLADGFSKKIVKPETIGQYTGLKDSTKWADLTEPEREAWTLAGNMPSEWKGKEIYEGDIVCIFTSRVPQYEQAWNPRSKHDVRKIESRSVVVFKRFEWRLDTDTKYNRKILELKGKETEQRRLTIHEHLNDYDFFQESNPNSAWNREHNAHAYWSDIEVIGNVHENSDLLK